MPTPSTAGALEAIDGILDRGGDADEVLRDVVGALTERAGYAWAGVFFTEEGVLQLGPQAGEPDESRRTTVDVVWSGARVAVLAVDGARVEDAAFLERVAVLVSGQCLVGWDTGGEPWES
jgi:putative methionine-R-sulfoxide reductase with GAF domain